MPLGGFLHLGTWVELIAREEGCIHGFSTEVNFHLRFSFFVDGETQEGCGRRSKSDLAIPTTSTRHPGIYQDTSPSPPSLATTTTTAVSKLRPMCKRRIGSPPSRLCSASSSLPHSPTSACTCTYCDHIHPRSRSPRRLPAWMQRVAADVHPSPQHLRGFTNTL